MKTIVTHRRQFLRSGTGFALSLPFLSSLASPPRSYAAAVSTKKKRFAAMLTWHGGIHEADMFPLAAATQKMDLFPGHAINFGPLSRTVSGNVATVSPVLSGAQDKLTASLAAKMNVYRGLDNPFYFSHGGGVQLGNVGGNDGFAGGDQLLAQKAPNVTIDQQMAWSPSFYQDGIPRQRYIYHFSHYNFGDQDHSYTWSSPSSRSGNIVHTRNERDLGKIFDSLFSGTVSQTPPGTPVVQRALIVDKVLASYKSLRDGNGRISPLDKQRLSDYMDRISELERKLIAARAQQQPSALCKVPTKPSTAVTSLRSPLLGNSAVTHFQLLNDITAAAFICDATRVAVAGSLNGEDTFIPYTGDWHQNVAHQYFSPEPRKMLAGEFQIIFEKVLLDLAVKLDLDEGDGSTILDNSLLLSSQESGAETHVPLSIPIITFGSAGGYFKTGNFVDYRRMLLASQLKLNRDSHYTGITYNRMMANVLQAMGVDSKEWATATPGFGQTFLSVSAKGKYSPQVLSTASDPMPIVT